jgi:hypothetical protein
MPTKVGKSDSQETNELTEAHTEQNKCRQEGLNLVNETKWGYCLYSIDYYNHPGKVKSF